ncbi:uncharacterized protein LOC122244719 isoform X2 [Penaeus japonicus]|nr:uncharacterized protein LOC122244719 isoform X2 [Penaeus japonicus]XP_042858634.1 uncharacterized protein LOC122244719 isoform X2 [Penaeus japonicus]
MGKLRYSTLMGTAVFMVLSLVWIKDYMSTIQSISPIDFRKSQEIKINNTLRVFPYPTLTKECFSYDKINAENICCQMHNFHELPEILQCVKDTARDLLSIQRQNEAMQILQKSSRGKKAARKRNNKSQQPIVNWAFFGDSHARYIFCAIYSRMRSQDFQCRIPSFKGKWRSLGYLHNLLPTCTYRGGIIEIRHVKLPFVFTFYRDVYLTEIKKYAQLWDADEHLRPTFIVMNSGNHWMRRLVNNYVKNGVEAAGRIFETHLRSITPVLRNLAQKTTVIFKMQDDLQTVHHNVSKVVSFSTENIKHYNGIFRRVLADTGVLLWDSTLPLSLAYNLECMDNPRHINTTLWWMCGDRTHVGYILLHQYADMVLNVACNKHMVMDKNSCYQKNSTKLM